MIVVTKNDFEDDKNNFEFKNGNYEKKKLGHWPSPQLDVSKPGHKLNLRADTQDQLSNTYH
jgi:hypothetical protein